MSFGKGGEAPTCSRGCSDVEGKMEVACGETERELVDGQRFEAKEVAFVCQQFVKNLTTDLKPPIEPKRAQRQSSLP